ncbi:hypothetical protein Scep_025845 [Stephania cephalantha]|uniref:Uncharacterized protein n=1 Tax=Stephania cephalantha TaxID=152367 RepID=A0AAP0EJ08_9MAGN
MGTLDRVAAPRPMLPGELLRGSRSLADFITTMTKEISFEEILVLLLKPQKLRKKTKLLRSLQLFRKESAFFETGTHFKPTWTSQINLGHVCRVDVAKRSGDIRKKEETHIMARANIAFAHIR